MITTREVRDVILHRMVRGDPHDEPVQLTVCQLEVTWDRIANLADDVNCLRCLRFTVYSWNRSKIQAEAMELIWMERFVAEKVSRIQGG